MSDVKILRNHINYAEIYCDKSALDVPEPDDVWKLRRAVVENLQFALQKANDRFG